ncbi:hypothetical protein NE237_027109 [Protea cynaroides]|uniref:AAA ATPase AAA+ lid domain-containing protein n=1 Tax=Protea cynaroides TaxID=273540 RepID=A0A9Q0GQN7_9MAGN|nr:hypothetical protein NE237_027109 [Protea cynaroides]
MAPEPEEINAKNPRPLDEDDIALLKTYGLGPYSTSIKKAEKEIKEMTKKVNDLCDTGLAAPSQWDLVSDKQMMQEEQPLQVARCTKINNQNSEDFVVGLDDKVSPTDIEEGMRIQNPFPPKIHPSVTMMTVEEKPDVTYNDVGGCKEQIEKMREVVELPMLHPEKFVKLGIDPPKELMLASSVLLEVSLSRNTLVKGLVWLGSFSRPDTLDSALLRPGRLDRKVEFGLPYLESRTQIFKIHTRTMNCERDIRFELLARLCPNSTGADIRSVCTEAGMFAIRARRKTVTEKDFLDAVNKVIKGYQKFSATPKYMVYN